MEEKPYYSRRLTNNELDIWLGMELERDALEYSKQYMNLEESMFFASYLADDVVGVSSIFRDKARMSMLLSGLRVNEDLRVRLTKHIIKTSLPFFKTVAIREVDALVNTTGKSRIPFPITSELGHWVQDALLENEFNHFGDYQRISFKIPKEEIQGRELDDSVMSNDKLKELFWRIQPQDRPDHAPLWMGFHISDISTLSSDDEVILAIGTVDWQDTLFVSSLMYDYQQLAHSEVSHILVHLAKKHKRMKLTFNIIPQESELITEIVDLCGPCLEIVPLKLYRKSL